MTSFGMVFKAMFARKRKGVWQVLWLSLLASVVTLIIGMIRAGLRGDFYQTILTNGELHPFAAITMLLGTSMLLWGGLGIVAYFLISMRQNAKINRSSTWRLIPISTAKFYGSNLLTAFVCYVILGLIYAGIEILLFLPTMLDEHANTAQGFHHIFSAAVLSKIDPWTVLGGVVFLLLLGLLVYTGISLISLGSLTLAEYLPANAAKLGKFIIAIIFYILAVWLLNILGSAYQRWVVIMFDGDSQLWINNLIFLLLDAAFFGINVWLLRDFVEAH